MTVKRMTFMQELLSFIGLGERLHLSWISSAEAGKFADVARRFTEKIRKMGPNPLTGYRLDQWLAQVQEKEAPASHTGHSQLPQPRTGSIGRKGP